MATEKFNPGRLILTMEGTSLVYREQLGDAILRLGRTPLQEAEDLVAIAGEDERAYGLRPRAGFVDTLCERMDEFLGDDDGGFFRMRIHVTTYERSDAALELWFHVGRDDQEQSGIWIRHMIVGVDEEHVYSDIGGHRAPPGEAAD